MSQTNHAMEFSKTMRFINDPTMGMVELLKGGHILSDAGGIAQAKQCLKDVKLRLEEREDEIRRYKDTGFLETDGGKQLLARAAMFGNWVKTIEAAIVEGKKEIKRQAEEKLQKEAQQFISMARESLPRCGEGDIEIISKVLEFATLLGDRTLSQVIDPVLESRRKYKIAIRNLTRLRDEEKVAGIPDLPAPPADDGLSEAFNKFRTIDHSVGNFKRRRFREIKK